MKGKIIRHRRLLFEVLAAALFVLAVACGVAGQFGSTSPQDSPLSIGTNGLHLAYIQHPYLAVLMATGGTPPYFWSVSPGVLPPGLSLRSTSGQISGALKRGGRFSATIKGLTTPTWWLPNTRQDLPATVC
jgi:hypothetical protein